MIFSVGKEKNAYLKTRIDSIKPKLLIKERDDHHPYFENAHRVELMTRDHKSIGDYQDPIKELKHSPPPYLSP